MKKLFTIMISLLVAATSLSAQTTKETIKERRMIAKQSRTELNAKASKAARKEAKVLKKQGWLVAPGHLPLDKQLDKSYSMYYEYEENGLPKYIVGDAMSVGSTYDAAKSQALELAKTNLAGQIQTEVTSLIESTVANQQMTSTDAASIVRTVQASKNLISQRLGRVFPVTELYRQVNKNTVEVRVTIAYNAKMAMEAAKEVIKAQLEEKGEELHKQLDKALGF